eukprot:CAMPEP_0206158022 /NCGR_PEP_ID=MMETSP1474-20131121/4463_1 /ASSEMBLY_ACC=CAM_ASM_001110 /TAXON_ID=97495 /ORGANISM="Imantonia sp., Strain RCC918" /LENGTH=46 /DNA_ID= /DNA_START= /DNA_END= /DNA_ORIENTATION=
MCGRQLELIRRRRAVRAAATQLAGPSDGSSPSRAAPPSHGASTTQR